MNKIPRTAILNTQNRAVTKLWLFGLLFNFLVSFAFAHPITGVWRGQVKCGKGGNKITSTIEVKLFEDGKNIVGTIYYIGTGKNYIRYSLKGSFWGEGNSIYWQDYSIVNLKVKKTKKVHDFNETMKYFANYSGLDDNNGKLSGYCMLDGMPQMNFELKKMEGTLFPDEWDAVIAGHDAGMVSKEIMDSVWAIASEPGLSGEVGLPLNNTQVKRELEWNQINNDSPGSEEIETAIPGSKPGNSNNPGDTDTKKIGNNYAEWMRLFQKDVALPESPENRRNMDAMPDEGLPWQPIPGL